MEVRTVGGRSVSKEAFRYALLFHDNPHLPWWWKVKFFASEIAECGFTEPQLAQEHQDIQP